MKYTDIEIGMKVIARPINFATHEQDVTHMWYGKIATVIDIGENPYLEQVCVSMDAFPMCNRREYKNRFWYCAEELEEADPAEYMASECVEYMVNEGRNQTLTGNYHFEFEEIENKFGIVVDDDMKENICDYVVRNYNHMVAELDMSEDFDFTFYTDYCPNIES